LIELANRLRKTVLFVSELYSLCEKAIVCRTFVHFTQLYFLVEGDALGKLTQLEMAISQVLIDQRGKLHLLALLAAGAQLAQNFEGLF
jgi:hypothetical protein